MPYSRSESIFTYPLTRHYPFRWFTWVVVVGCAILTILFSFVALAADGYNASTEYTTDLNGTLNQKYWFQKPPFSWAQKVETSCESALLTPGISYFTSNLGLQYSLDAIWQETQNTQIRKTLPAAPYRNASLSDCEVSVISIDFQRMDTGRLGSNWWSWGRTAAKATTTCTVYSPDLGALRANFTVQLPSTKNSDQISQNFLSLDIYARANMWFGAQFLVSWYGQLSTIMGYSAPSNAAWDSGSVDLTRNPATKDYTSLTFFLCNAFFPESTGALAWMDPQNTIADWANKSSVSPDGSRSQFSLPNISITVDAFAKTFYSLILSDFGIMDDSNALITADGVRYLQSRNDTELVAASVSENSPLNGQGSPISNINDNSSNPGYPIINAYESVVRDLGHTPILDSTKADSTGIFAQYLCTVPKMKSGGSLLFSVLLADVVFLQLCWNILNLAATTWLERQDPHMNQCDTCRDAALIEPDAKAGNDTIGSNETDSDELIPLNAMTNAEYLGPQTDFESERRKNGL